MAARDVSPSPDGAVSVGEAEGAEERVLGEWREEEEEERGEAEAAEGRRTPEEAATLREPDAEAALRSKEAGNALFKDGKVEEALARYREAIALSPVDEADAEFAAFVKHRAVFHGNAAACLLALKRWEECVEECDRALDLDDAYEKVALRRAAALEGLEKWADAIEDYEDILERFPGNPVAKARIEAVRAKEKEHAEKMKDEMMGKLKDVGNSVLGWFGLSTDNFKVVQDPGTGGYSISFQQNAQAPAPDGSAAAGSGGASHEH